jgi:hypothetical protein
MLPQEDRKRPKSTKAIVFAIILGGWLLVVVFAFAHHGFGLAIDKQTILDYPKTKRLLVFHPRSQGSANAFVRGVALSLTVAAVESSPK